MNENINLESHLNRIENLNDAIKCIQVALAEGTGGIDKIACNALYELTNTIEEEIASLNSIDIKIKKYKVV